MSLRPQLWILALSLLLLPWAGCSYVREMEEALRTSQAEALQAQARLLQQIIARQWISGPQHQATFYTPVRYQPVQIDGYDDDWQSHAIETLTNITSPQGQTQEQEQPKLEVQLQKALFKDRLYLMVKVQSPQQNYYQPGSDFQLQDHLQLHLEGRQGTLDWVLFTSAPGSVSLRQWDSTTQRLTEVPNAEAWWQETPHGYNLELSIPVRQLLTRLDVSWHQQQPQPLQFSTRTTEQASLWLSPIPEFTPYLTQYRSTSQDLLLVNAEGWPVSVQRDWLADSTLIDAPSTLPLSLNQLLNRVYRLFINALTPSESRRPWPLAETTLGSTQQRLDLSALSLASDGSHVGWYQQPSAAGSQLLVVEPINHRGKRSGYLLLTQTGDALVSLTNDALRKATHRTLLILILVLILLIGFASLLSWRIQRLNQAVDRAVELDGLSTDFKPSKRQDEVGELSRSFASLLTRVHQNTEYLTTLNNKLAHELRTPLAITQSSLELLEADPGNNLYLQRAASGIERLRYLLSTMSEASRVEQSIEQADFQRFNASNWLEELTAAYGQTYPEFDMICEMQVSNAIIWGSPELLTQMMDKLIENARSFADSGTAIRTRLTSVNGRYRLAVTNQGPALPEGGESRLFDSLVSNRGPSSQHTETHLGLGLFIVKLIANAHGGQTLAFNQPPDSVVFTVELPMPKIFD